MSGVAVFVGAERLGSVLTPGGSTTVLVVTRVVGVTVELVEPPVEVVVPGFVVVVAGGAVQSFFATEMSLPVWTVTMSPRVTIAGL